MNENEKKDAIVARLNVIQMAVNELEGNLKPTERVLVAAAIGDIKNAAGSLREIIAPESPGTQGQDRHQFQA